jgi:Cu/Ag efflux protein CusF
MSEQQPESYEAPTVEEIDLDGKPIVIASEAVSAA